ncbi:hypothetical protein NHF46_17340 [Arthrobacter alpinus]|nr:hypothetical protein [Arthrobacter alpinus]
MERPAPVIPACTFELSRGTALLDFVRAIKPVHSVKPLSFEKLGLDRGLVHYSAKAVLPAGEATIKIRGLHDRAYLWVDGNYVGVVTDANGETGVNVTTGGDWPHWKSSWRTKDASITGRSLVRAREFWMAS